jgi:hypothetical protein
MVGETDDDVVYPVIGNKDLIATGLSTEHDEGGRDAYALFGNDVGCGPVLVYLVGDDARMVEMTAGTVVASNTNSTSDSPSSSVATSGKRKSK